MRLRLFFALIVAALSLLRHVTHALPVGSSWATIEPEYSFVHRGRLYQTFSANATGSHPLSSADSRIAISLAIDAAVPRRFIIDLTPNTGLFAHTYTTFSPGDGGRGRPIAASERCHYLGDVYEDASQDIDAELVPHGPAAVSICDGILTGLITVDHELYDVSPAVLAPFTRSHSPPGVLSAGNLWRRLAFPTPRAAPPGEVLPAEEVGAHGYTVQRLGELERGLAADAAAAAAADGAARGQGEESRATTGHWCGLQGLRAVPEKNEKEARGDDGSNVRGDDGLDYGTDDSPSAFDASEEELASTRDSEGRTMRPSQFFFDNPFQPRPRLHPRPFFPQPFPQPRHQPQPQPQPRSPSSGAGAGAGAGAGVGAAPRGSASGPATTGNSPPASPGSTSGDTPTTTARRPTLNELLGPNAHLRRRPWSPLRVPTSPQFIELHLFHDAARLERFSGDAGAALRSGARVANAVDALYRTNGFSPPIRVVLVGQTVLETTPDALLAPSVFSPQRQRRETDPNALLRGFLSYSDPSTPTGKPSDARALLTGRYLQGSVVGLAQLGDMCVPAYSGVIAQAVPEAFGEGVLAMIVAHELGHGLGMPHDGDPEEMDTIDGETLPCPGGGHIMSVYTSAAARFDTFSRCSREFVRAWFFIDAKSASMCLANTPAATWSEVVCGNGIVEPGEACDCGPPGSAACARDPCCVPELCILAAGAACSEAEPCCEKCQPVPASAARECRPARHPTCDTREVCDGKSGKCPADQFAPLGTRCVPPVPVAEVSIPGLTAAAAGGGVALATTTSTFTGASARAQNNPKDGRCFSGTCQSVRTTCAAFNMYPCPVQPPAEQCRRLLCSPTPSPATVADCRPPPAAAGGAAVSRAAAAAALAGRGDGNAGEVPVPEGMPCNKGRGQCLSGLCVATGLGEGGSAGQDRGHAVSVLLGIPEPWVWVVIAVVAGMLLVTAACCAARCCRPSPDAAAAGAGGAGGGWEGRYGEPQRAVPLAAVPHRGGERGPGGLNGASGPRGPGGAAGAREGEGGGIFVGGRQVGGGNAPGDRVSRPPAPYTEEGAALGRLHEEEVEEHRVLPPAAAAAASGALNAVKESKKHAAKVSKSKPAAANKPPTEARSKAPGQSKGSKAEKLPRARAPVAPSCPPLPAQTAAAAAELKAAAAPVAPACPRLPEPLPPLPSESELGDQDPVPAPAAVAVSAGSATKDPTRDSVETKKAAAREDEVVDSPQPGSSALETLRASELPGSEAPGSAAPAIEKAAVVAEPAAQSPEQAARVTELTAPAQDSEAPAPASTPPSAEPLPEPLPNPLSGPLPGQLSRSFSKQQLSGQLSNISLPKRPSNVSLPDPDIDCSLPLSKRCAPGEGQRTPLPHALSAAQTGAAAGPAGAAGAGGAARAGGAGDSVGGEVKRKPREGVAVRAD